MVRHEWGEVGNITFLLVLKVNFPQTKFMKLPPQENDESRSHTGVPPVHLFAWIW